MPERRDRGAPQEGMPTRVLGKTGQRVSALGLGGSHIGQPNLTSREAVRIIRTALDRGLSFMDNSWDYNDGESEIRVGKALKDGYRDKAFVMTKVDGRSKKEASRQINQSLKRLGVDHIDLLQHHEVIRFDDAEQNLRGRWRDGSVSGSAPGRLKIRYIGFTGPQRSARSSPIASPAKPRIKAFDLTPFKCP